LGNSRNKLYSYIYIFIRVIILIMYRVITSSLVVTMVSDLSSVFCND
jgi:hypothetical protein